MTSRDPFSKRQVSGNIDVVVVPGSGHEAVHVNVRAPEGRDRKALFSDLAAVVEELHIQPVSQVVFGAREWHAEGMGALGRCLGEPRWPVTWIDGGTELLGTQMTGVRGVAVEALEDGGQVVGTTFEDDCGRHCYVGNVFSKNATGSRNEQARDAFEGLERALGLVGMDFSHVVRTWLYNDDILDWYSDFNEVRWQFFDERGIATGVMPASTGIGATNPAGASVVAECVAIKPEMAGVSTEVVESPLQCPASDYRSSFSRAAELYLCDERRLFVSGTASIAPEGETAHVGDVPGQISLTMEVVEAILISRNMGWRDVTRGIAYFPDLRDAPLLDSYCEGRGLPRLPLAITQGIVCRDDLLFEIEVDAVAPRT